MYNLKTDISEQVNLTDGNAELARKMDRDLSRWQSEVEALIPKRNVHWTPLPDDADPATD